jgi:hypothetical protein
MEIRGGFVPRSKTHLHFSSKYRARPKTAENPFRNTPSRDNLSHRIPPLSHLQPTNWKRHASNQVKPPQSETFRVLSRLKARKSPSN